MRAGVIAGTGMLMLASSPQALAEPTLDASGFVGVWWPGNTELGNSWAPDQAPGVAPVLGARIGWLAVPRLVERGRLDLALAVEAELALATAFTGETDGGRMSYFAPVFGWRVHAMLRQRSLGSSKVGLHLLAGGGGATVTSSSPFMAKETDPVAYLGSGVTYAMSDRWQLRVDVRRGLTSGRDASTTFTTEMQFGLIAAFALPKKQLAAPPPPEPPPLAKVDDTDGDGDGLPDRLDQCPTEAETINGLHDEDGCPEPDPDGDGLIGTADACPTQAEDFDRFEDTDGCPDPDNDGDGIEDPRDVCPNEPETKNGFEDTDGCPDAIPEAITHVLASVRNLKFEPGRARVTEAGKQAVAQLLALLQTRRELRLVVVGHPERAGTEELAKRRADALKWYLVDQGLTEDRLETRIGAIGTPAIELLLVP